MSKKNTLSAYYAEILENQRIDEDSADSTIVRDFETLLGFIGSNGIQVSGEYNFFQLKALAYLNSQMTNPIEIDLKRPQQKSYPNIHGLYLLLRVTGLTCVNAIGKKQHLFLDEAVLESWHSLNLTERYFTLLEAWLLKGDTEILGERMGPMGISIIRWRDFFKRIPASGLKLTRNIGEESNIMHWSGTYTIALLELFGFISIQHGKPKDGKGWQIISVHRTAYGNALLKLLSESLIESESEYLWSTIEDEMEDKINADFGALQPIIQPFFPEWHKNLIIPKPQFQDGIYIFKVSLGNIWRRIAIPGKKNFDSLSAGILNSVDFDFDHLYEFKYKNRFGLATHINHPSIEESPWADEVLIGEVGLTPNKTITYLYDFGDNWEFDVTLERIDPLDPKIKKPVVLEAHGEAPEQYSGWD